MRIVYRSITEIVDDEHGIRIPAGTEMTLVRMSFDGIALSPVGLEWCMSIIIPVELFNQGFRIKEEL